jgi:hypothetical protein
MIDTKQVSIRTLQFATLDDALREAERLAAAARAGTCKQLGNWSEGTVFGHLAWWIEAIDRDEIPKPPFFVRLLGPMLKRQLIGGPLPKGFRMPGTATGTRGDEPCDLEVGIERLRKAYARLQTQPLPAKHPVFGAMSRDEWLTLHRRHAELHLAFLEVQ